MVKQSTSAGLAFLIVIVISVLLLAPVSSAILASGSAAQEADTTPTPPFVAADETAQPVETSQPQGSPPAAQGSDHGSVMFVENAGQWDVGARFQVWGGPTGTMWLAQDAIWIVVASGRWQVAGSDAFADPPADLQPANLQPATLHAIRLSFVGASPQPRIETHDRVETAVSYFLGNDPNQWRPEVPVWGGVRYVELYPDVDLELTSENGQMTPRLAARPGADLSAVRLRVEGADAVSVDGDVLRLSTAAGEVVWPLLSVDGIQVPVSQVEASGVQAFDVAVPFVPANSHRPAANDTQRSLATNPADLIYGTFLGGSDGDDGYGIAVDGAGSAYVTGGTSSSNFPTTPGVFDPSHNGGSEVFVAKLNPTGSGLAYATFLGGSGSDTGSAIAVDGAGSAYVTGETSSSNFPTTPGAFDTTFGYGDAFVVKLNPAGSRLVYSTFLGGTGGYLEWGSAIAVDRAGNAYVAGLTSSHDFPTTPGAFDTSHNGGECNYNTCPDAFVTKLNPAGSGLVYSTFLGGTSDYSEGASDIAVDGAGNAYVTGSTHSSDFPTTPGAFDTSYNDPGNGGYGDTFVVKLNPSGSGLAYATFLGGGGNDTGNAIAVDSTGSAYVTGETRSSDFPTTPGAFDTSLSGYGDAFVAKLNPAGSALTYATFLGGSGGDYGFAIAVDGAAGATVIGLTGSSDFPTTPGAFDPSFNGGYADAFVAKLNPAGSGLVYATFLGGGDYDYGNAIAVDGVGRAYVAGSTRSSDFPTTPGAFDPSYNGGTYDAFVVKLAMAMFPKGYLPLIVNHSLPLPAAPMLNGITPPGANPRYTVRWNAVPSTTSYVLQRATSASFADATQVYAGTGTSTTIASQGIARYHYRVKARNQWGDSPWSNVQSVEVRWEQEPNYPLAQANGPLLSGLSYYGYPNDASDYFFFQVASRGQVTIDLTNHTGLGLQLVLRTSTGALVTQVNVPPYHLVATVDPGRYYVHIYSIGNFNSTTPYTLRAVFP